MRTSLRRICPYQAVHMKVRVDSLARMLAVYVNVHTCWHQHGKQKVSVSKGLRGSSHQHPHSPHFACCPINTHIHLTLLAVPSTLTFTSLCLLSHQRSHSPHFACCPISTYIHLTLLAVPSTLTFTSLCLLSYQHLHSPHFVCSSQSRRQRKRPSGVGGIRESP